MTPKTLGDRIQSARFTKGLNHTELAQELGVSKSLVSLWERDRATPSEAHLKALGRVFKLQNLGQPVKPNS